MFYILFTAITLITVIVRQIITNKSDNDLLVKFNSVVDKRYI